MTAPLPTRATRVVRPGDLAVRRPPRRSAGAGAEPLLAAPAATGPTPVPSFERFYETERAAIGRAIAFALGDADLAAEATDEAFVRAYERWPSVSQGNPPAWVYRVAMNWALSILRRRRRGVHRLYEPPDHEQAVVEPAVHAALAELDPKHRSVVVCRHVLGWSVAETAAALHLREGTVKSRLSRANQILQARLRHLRTEEDPS
ncbi:sigma-70 family RNA polymerase sigma factor [Aquihabitans sp. G128]|uniref:RNA polymerase sigma factor n=1 Tax=Aquihabitans sp. G128 TaxID=2849779 RepID=UPI001C21A1CA|nr:sigma-70 family RNA polymerase sigma factor [Aquihabitans sp. G128]QXC62728.1 sigma-70 family RNA polymerase sigma factor [Aquihabitans sp. G128]